VKNKIDVNYTLMYSQLYFTTKEIRMIALCPNGKKILFLTDDPREVNSIIYCTCEKEVHHKSELVFNPSEELMDSIRADEDME
jgi:hypothetical protein